MEMPGLALHLLPERPLLADALLLMIQFFLWAEVARSIGTVRRIAEGFAVYGLVAVGAEVTRQTRHCTTHIRLEGRRIHAVGSLSGRGAVLAGGICSVPEELDAAESAHT